MFSVSSVSTFHQEHEEQADQGEWSLSTIKI